MIAAVQPRLHDAGISREIGMLLGSALGQMRVQFNVKTYVVEPAYRDDGLGLWDFGQQAQPAGEVIEVPIEAARVERQETPDISNVASQNEENEAGPAKARPVAADHRGLVMAKYPEWDREHRVERAEWTFVRELPPATGEPRLPD
jgi:nitric oxide reductase NorD protein